MLDEAIAALDKLLVPGHSTIALKLVDWKEVRAAVRDVALAAGAAGLHSYIEAVAEIERLFGLPEGSERRTPCAPPSKGLARRTKTYEP